MTYYPVFPEGRSGRCRCVTHNGSHMPGCPEYRAAAGSVDQPVKYWPYAVAISRTSDGGSAEASHGPGRAASFGGGRSAGKTVGNLSAAIRESQTVFPWRCEGVLRWPDKRDFEQEYRQEFPYRPRDLASIIADATSAFGPIWSSIIDFPDEMSPDVRAVLSGKIDGALTNLLREAFLAGEQSVAGSPRPVFNGRLLALDAVRDRQQAKIDKLIEWGRPAAWSAFCAFFPPWKSDKPVAPAGLAKRWDDGPGMVRT